MEHRKRTRLLLEDTHSLPNLLLTICDDVDDEVGMDASLDDESHHEYLIGSSDLAAHIKQEQETQALPAVQYRIVSNQLHQRHHLHHHHHRVQAAAAEAATTTATLLPTAVQLPSGCEIYLVKEYVEPVVTTTSIPRMVTTTTGGLCGGGGGSGGGGGGCSSIAGIGNVELLCSNISTMPSATVTRTIKLEPRQVGSGQRGAELNANIAAAATRNGVHIVRKVNASTQSTVAAGTATGGGGGGGVVAGGVSVGIGAGKRSYILETYKKRDDKRRATHNEVERRRRDKINSWIFKLKEMLPAAETSNSTGSSTNNTKITNSNSNTSNNCSSNSARQKTTQTSTLGNSNNTTRTTNDSKSQILIKACEYIKNMQDEMNSLRECLTENENLRSCNQRLESELDKLKAAYAKLNNSIYNGCNNNSSSGGINSLSKYNLTLNSLNSSHNSNNNNNNSNNNNNNNSNIFMSANNALEILPVVAEFDSALLLAAVTSNSVNCTTSNPTLSYATAKHELILNDLNI